MNKIILVGYKSFLQRNLYIFFKKKNLKVFKKKFSELKNYKLNEGDTIINCSINNKFFYEKYNKKNDRNLIICKFIKDKNINFVMLSTRQVYKPKLNINEKSYLKPINIYARNYYKSEFNCKKIFNKKITILRVSNVFGYDFGRKKRLSLLKKMQAGIKKGQITLDSSHSYQKDILPINFFCLYLFKIITKKIKGLVNLGSGQSMTLLQIAKILINKRSDVVIKIDQSIPSNDGSYTYDIKKLYNLTKLRFSKREIINEILKVRKLIS